MLARTCLHTHAHRTGSKTVIPNPEDAAAGLGWEPDLQPWGASKDSLTHTAAANHGGAEEK